MSDLIAEGDLTIRRSRDDAGDYAWLSRWLTDQRVLAFYDGRDQPSPPDRVQERYSVQTLAADGVTPCLVVYQDAPAGYLQFYPDGEESVFGIDQFIGEVELWNRGLGTRMVSLIVRYLFEFEGARKIIVDPHVDNPRAIRCYEKCGFRKVRMLPEHELHEGVYRDCWFMEITRDR